VKRQKISHQSYVAYQKQGIRRSTRHRKVRGEKALLVSANQTLKELKIQVRWFFLRGASRLEREDAKQGAGGGEGTEGERDSPARRRKAGRGSAGRGVFAWRGGTVFPLRTKSACLIVLAQIMHAFSVAPFDQNLSIDGKMLSDDTATLGSLGVIPESVILLKVTRGWGCEGERGSGLTRFSYKLRESAARRGGKPPCATHARLPPLGNLTSSSWSCCLEGENPLYFTFFF